MPALPDPIKLLRRIHALEYSVAVLQTECADMVQRRQEAVQDAVQQLALLREATTTTPFQDVPTGVSTNDGKNTEYERIGVCRSTNQLSWH